MTTHRPHSLSPRVSETTSPRVQPGNPTTPVHSPHHSLTSTISSRTPIHTLTIHEYRKQQNTPNSQKGAPLGKTLRRKAAASALSEIERVPSVTRSTQSGSVSSLHPLHFSHSAQPLRPSQAPFEQQALLTLSLRSQSAEPRVQGGSISSIVTTSSSGKVRNFNSRKRLPRPPAATGPVFPTPFANVKSTHLRRSPLPVALSFSSEHSHSSHAQTEPTPSTFSLSRFPQPPHFDDPSFSPPRDEREVTRVNALSFSTTAPATPPATPATIHYRGASFDLVNPHDSLLFHEIVTPSRDFDSSDFLPLRSSEEPLLESSEMAPKRPLYGNLNAAHAGIMRRAEDSLGGSNMDLPHPPTPAAISPSSSAYTSPFYSPESISGPSPLSVKKPTNESRFSLKQLTRTLTKKLGKSPVDTHDEELQDMRHSSVSIASIDTDGEYPRPLTQTYVVTPQTSYIPLSAMSPVTPVSPTSPRGSGVFSPENNEVEFPRRHPNQHDDVEPLTSMVPDDPSTQVGRMDSSQFGMTEEGTTSKPYYDDLDSIYPSSSIYTGDDRRMSNYQHSLASNRQSNPFVRYSGMDASGFADRYNRDSLYGYSSAHTGSRQMSRLLTQELYNHSVDQGDAKTDTISKLIDEYHPGNTVDSSSSIEQSQIVNSEGMATARPSDLEAESSSTDRPQQARVTSGLSQFEFDLRQNETQGFDHEVVSPIQTVMARRPTFAQAPGSPPRGHAPLAPAFEYDEADYSPRRLEQSEMVSNGSSYSYGDTRNLLQISQCQVSVPPVLGELLEPSSSYSQPEAKALEPSSSYSQAENASPQTPPNALAQAEKISHDVVSEHRRTNHEIPAMWARRNSGSLLLSKKVTNQSSGDPKDLESAAGAVEEEKADWETLAGHSQGSRGSLDSIADYSSSEGTRNSLGLNPDGSLPSWAKQNLSQGASFYSHPSPIRTHPHPFSLSPPHLQARASGRVRTAPEGSSTPMSSSPPVSSTVPLFRFSTRSQDVLGRGAVEEPYAFAPWTDPYAFSDKETQELLASGPNDDIIIDDQTALSRQPTRVSNQHEGRATPRISPKSVSDGTVSSERKNSFEKVAIVGPKGNLTGTPRGTGMHETGSSVADNSSPGLRLSSSVGRQSIRSDYTGFYAVPFPATGSVTRIRDAPAPPEPQHDRTPSETTLFPRAHDSKPVQESSPLAGANRRQPLRYSTTFHSAPIQSVRRSSRAAVPGQTKLRQMVLASEARATMSSQDTHFSRFMNGSERPSTSDTTTPLRPSHRIDVYPATTRRVVAHAHSPHLLCPERDVYPEDEARRRKLSWIILAAFCLLPPCILLFRLWGDSVIISLTKGRLGHCTVKSKRAALIVGICVNLGLVAVILVPILVVHAFKVV